MPIPGRSIREQPPGPRRRPRERVSRVSRYRPQGSAVRRLLWASYRGCGRHSKTVLIEVVLRRVDHVCVKVLDAQDPPQVVMGHFTPWLAFVRTQVAGLQEDGRLSQPHHLIEADLLDHLGEDECRTDRIVQCAVWSQSTQDIRWRL